jgi:hypothetical protein
MSSDWNVKDKTAKYLSNPANLSQVQRFNQRDKSKVDLGCFTDSAYGDWNFNHKE